MVGEGKFFDTLTTGEKTVIPGGIAFEEATNVFLTDGDGNILHAAGLTVPGDVAGYAKGCLFIDKNVVDGTSGLYVNVGTVASADFELITSA